MNKEDILAYLNSGKINKELIITEYCLEKGKDPHLTKDFVMMLRGEAFWNQFGGAYLLDYCYEYALIYYIMKYSIILAYDKNGKFIKAF